MCGIVGYVGNRLCQSSIIQALKRLEYRGYDSAGFACINPSTNTISTVKAVGYLDNLKQKLVCSPAIDGYIGIAHTRWATHGAITEINAHPHFSCDNAIAVVHNGIIENHQELRQSLMKRGHQFMSATDTEVIAHLHEEYAGTSIEQSVLSIVDQLTGAYACLLLNQCWPDTLVVIRKGSPLCIGIGNQEMFIASDPLAFAGKTDRVIFLSDATIGIINATGYALYDFSLQKINPIITTINMQWSEDGKCGYDHFMLKEIYEQKVCIQSTLSSCINNFDDIWDALGLDRSYIRSLRSLHLIGCGTSWNAACIAQFFFESIAQIPTRVMLASEFRYLPFFPEEQSAYIAISQSGETADTLECIRLINMMQLPTITLTNVPSSTLAREAKGAFFTKAGYEISVASTKAFSTQLISLFWLAHRIGFEKGLITKEKMDAALVDVHIAAEVLENSIERYRLLIQESLAKYYARFKRFVFLGRHISYPFAMEAALKLKEISYIFSQCYPAGELKHGPIALLDADTPVVIFSCVDEQIYPKIVSNAQEVKARNAHIVTFAFENQQELIELADCVFVIPRVNPLLAPLAMTGLMQFLVYHIARSLNCPIDKPRNLAKSVTVE